MKWLRNKPYWLPVTLGLLGLFLLARVLLADAFILVPEDADVIILVALLAIALIAAIHTIVRISMNHLRGRSIRHARQETLAEHSRFLRRLDHELKNPLTALRTGLRTLVLTNLHEQQQQIVDAMETETLRLSRLVTDLRKLAELETEPLNLQPVNLATFAMTIIQMERERFEAGQRTLQSYLYGGQPAWLIDEDLLALAIHNLLDNAFKYSQPGDRIELRVNVQQELIIQVVDTGMGIEQSALAHVGEELYRAPQLEKIPGSGIGVALVRAIVERHQGAVTIESELGKGTIVTLHLPYVSQE
ncbi:MAG: HAMP domain-containing histidine kinase [Caldilineaceae bacterium]|nr:HAMP domain-containing histidine kinase [Caldilineaceae bacterium]